MLQCLDEDIRCSIFAAVFKASPRVHNPLLAALRGDGKLYPEALEIFYSINRVVLKLHFDHFVGRPLPTSAAALGYVRKLNIKQIAFHSETAPAHILQGVELLKLMPNVSDLRYAHFDKETSPMRSVKMAVEAFSLNRLRVEFLSEQFSSCELEKMETCLDVVAYRANACMPFRKSFVWEVAKGDVMEWREGGHIEDLGAPVELRADV